MSEPRDVDAERAVVGACLMHRSVRRAVSNDIGLLPEHFATEGLKRAYGAMLDMDGEDEPVDAMLVSRRISADPLVLDGLVGYAPAVGTVRAHAQRVLDVAGRRRKWHAAQQLLAAIDAEDDDEAATAEASLQVASRHRSSLTAEQLGSRLIDWMQAPAAPGISTGIRSLDLAIGGGGMRPGDTTVIGAWSSWGKSALADTIITNAARAGARCHAYVNEMSDIDRGLRMIARESSIAHSKLTTKNLDGPDYTAFVQRAADLPFGVTDVAGWNADAVSRDLRAQRWDVAVLDLLSNMPVRDEKELSAAITTLGAAALSSRTHLIVISQLNDARAKDGELPQPVVRDLRGSNMIRNVAASVLLIHRDQEEVDGAWTLLPGGHVVAGKHRHGRGGSVPVLFDHRSMSYRETYA